MTKQVLEIEVPDGQKAVWKDGRVVFEEVDSIKTVSDAIQFLSDKGIGEDILNSLSRLSVNSYEWKVAAYRAVVVAVTHNEQRHLTIGECWLPSIEFCDLDKVSRCSGNTIVGRIRSNHKDYAVVGGRAIYTTATSFRGLGHYSSLYDQSFLHTQASFLSVGTKKAALYISEQFGKLLFEVCFGGTSCNWKWV